MSRTLGSPLSLPALSQIGLNHPQPQISWYITTAAYPGECDPHKIFLHWALRILHLPLCSTTKKHSNTGV